MAFDPLTAAEVGAQGEASFRPAISYRFTITGDAAYATGGTVAFAQTLMLAVSQRKFYEGTTSHVQAVFGYGLTAGAITHRVMYNKTTDALLVYNLAGAQIADATDLSAVTFDLTVIAD